MNDVEQGRFLVDGLRIHFLHARSAEADGMPLLMTHGWPGSVVVYLDVVEPLIRAGFHCVVPSLPGYGWSDRPVARGWTVQRSAGAWAGSRGALGYRRYLAQRTDWGTSVAAYLAQQDPEHLIGVHVTPPLVDARHVRGDTGDGSGYSTEQRNRPQTIGPALTDSPGALAARVGEKLMAWTDPRDPLSDDQVLDRALGVLVHPHRGVGRPVGLESLHDVHRWLGGPLRPADLVDVPAGCRVFPYELQRQSRDEAAARFGDIRHWGTLARGGHFPAWEQPQLFVEEVQAVRAAL